MSKLTKKKPTTLVVDTSKAVRVNLPKVDKTAIAHVSQIGGNHYQARETLGGIQPWDVIGMNGYDWFQGEILKYIDRWQSKGGIADLRKAQSVIAKYIAVQESQLERVQKIFPFLKPEEPNAKKRRGSNS